MGPMVTDVAIRIRDRAGELLLDQTEWPERAVISVRAILELGLACRINGDCIDLKLTNARAVYRILDFNPFAGTYHGELVYSETPLLVT